jgi:hypothetical protein
MNGIAYENRTRLICLKGRGSHQKSNAICAFMQYSCFHFHAVLALCLESRGGIEPQPEGAALKGQGPLPAVITRRVFGGSPRIRTAFQSLKRRSFTVKVCNPCHSSRHREFRSSVVHNSTTLRVLKNDSHHGDGC